MDFVSGSSGPAKRFMLISFINVANHQMVLFIARNIWGWQGWQANVLAASFAAVPAYFLSRYWVWEVDGKISLRSEVIPFWLISALGLVISSLFVKFAESLNENWVIAQAASLVGYLFIWVMKFVLLNRIFSTLKTSDYEPIDRWGLEEARSKSS